MPRSAHLILSLALLALCLAAPLHPSAAKGPTELTVFSSPICSSCQEFAAKHLPSLQAGYGESLVVRTVDISTAEGLLELEQAESAANSFSNPLPVLLINGVLLADEDLAALTARLSEELQASLGPPSEAVSVIEPLLADTPEAAAGEQEAVCLTDCVPTRPIHIAYVSKAYCDVCDRTKLLLDVLRKEYPQIIVHEFDQSQDAKVLEAIGQHLQIPSDRRLIAPSIYVGESALIGGDQITSDALRAILDDYVEPGAPAFWTNIDTSLATGSILSRFRGLDVAAVALAGLIDGVNPCAFATILFFVSYLAISHRSRKEMLLVGGTFTVGVLITYFAVGVGAMRLLSLVEAVRGVGLVLYGLMALACLVLSALSLRDYVLARQGRLSDMSLNLPQKLRDRIHRRIRAGRGASVGAALITGIVISLLELACTGQVYLPTISYVMGVPDMRASALGYLALYNLAFILPLLVVLTLAAYGVSTRTFQNLFTRHAAKSKLAMAALFLVLGALLTVRVINL